MELRTERLRLREFTPSDFAALHHFASDPVTCEFVEWGPNTPQDTLDFLTLRRVTATSRTIDSSGVAGWIRWFLPSTPEQRRARVNLSPPDTWSSQPIHVNRAC